MVRTSLQHYGHKVESISFYMGNPSELSVSWDSSGKSFLMGAVKKKSSTNSEIITRDMSSLGTTSVTTSRTEVCGRNAGIFHRCFRKRGVD